jgi:hypothetical protein
MVLGLVVVVGLGLLLTEDPYPRGLNVYVFLGYTLGLLFAGMYIAVNLAAIGFYLGEKREDFNPIKHVVVPILGVAAMIPAFLSVIGGLTIPILDIELPSLTGDLVWVAPLVGVWMLVGIVLYFLLRARNPEAVENLGAVYGEGEL